MKHPEWTEDLSVGLHSLDSQHKQLIAISKALHTAIENGEGEAAMAETFDALEAYIKRHFENEEGYMREIGYPGLKEHLAQHEQLLLRFNMLWNRQKRHEPIKAEGVAFFLTEWITEHIQKYDIAIGRFVNARK